MSRDKQELVKSVLFSGKGGVEPNDEYESDRDCLCQPERRDGQDHDL